jgi:Flp pilus assembly protein TadD
VHAVDLDAVTHNNLGYLLRVRGEYAAAEKHYREAVRLLSESLGDGHATTLMVSSNLAGVLMLEGKVEEVLAIGRSRISAVEREWPDGHWRVGAAYAAQGRYLLREGRSEEAIEPLKAGVASYVATLGAGHTTTATLYAIQGAAMALAGRRTEGRSALDRAYGVLHGHPIALGAEQRQQISDMAALLRDGGFPADAARYLSLLDARQP